MSNSTIVLYHGAGCADGFGAAWAAHKALGSGSDVLYLPMTYSTNLPAEIDGTVSRIFILDFSFSRENMLKLAGLADQVVCLDHHHTAEQALDGLDGSVPGLTVQFDMDKSGAVLAWEYFHPGKPIPYLLQLVQDRDLWHWRLPGSKAYSAAIASYPKDWDTWDWLAGTIEDDYSEAMSLLSEGEAILRAQDLMVESIANRARYQDIAGYRVPVVNSPTLQSEVGDYLCNKHPDAPFAAMFSVLAPEKDGGPEKRVYSLRSRNGFDVSAVAKSMGGGGHKAAAGFTVIGGGK